MTLMVVTRGVLVFMDQYTLSEAASVFFDIGFGITVHRDPRAVLRAGDHDGLPRPRVITDYALAVGVAAFLAHPARRALLKDLYCDNYWPSRR